jgi:hypothetical protein
MQLAFAIFLTPLFAALAMGIDPEAASTGGVWAQLGFVRAGLLTLISVASFMLLLAMQAFALGPAAYIVLWNGRRQAAAQLPNPAVTSPAP